MNGLLAGARLFLWDWGVESFMMMTLSVFTVTMVIVRMMGDILQVVFPARARHS